jgi:non-specific serine/threonine protein kinase
MTLNNLGDVVGLQGDVAAARTLLSEALILAGEIGNRRRMAFTLSAVAGLAAAQGQAERAIRLDAAATAAEAAMGAVLAPPMRAFYDAELEPARQALGERGVAAARAAGAAMTVEQAVDEALAWLAAPADKGPMADVRTGLHGLTARECEVVVLVARGFSNPQIAEALVVGRRTAENHVAHICKKLGLTTRAQVAAWAVEHGLLHGGSPASAAHPVSPA